MVRGVRPYLEGRKLVAVRILETAYRPIPIKPTAQALEATVGGTVQVVRRLGKRVIFDLGERGTIAIEPRMTGLVLAADPPNLGHLRVEFRVAPDKTRSARPGKPASSGGRLSTATPPIEWTAFPEDVRKARSREQSIFFWDRRGLGTVTWYPAGVMDALLRGRSLGPDALEIDAAGWRAALGKSARPIKVALLDQKRVAGVGNLYASEILHLARIHPALAASCLTVSDWESLATAARQILLRAIEHEGSTLGDGTYRNALNQEGDYQNSHRVYARDGEPCPTCREATILRIVQAQRSTFYCETCQPLPKRGKGTRTRKPSSPAQ